MLPFFLSGAVVEICCNHANVSRYACQYRQDRKYRMWSIYSKCCLAISIVSKVNVGNTVNL